MLVGVRCDRDVDDEGGVIEDNEPGPVVRNAFHLELVRLSVGQRAERVDDSAAALGADVERRTAG